jgi:glycosyltransferase involved in cell wall biosynthesis
VKEGLALILDSAPLTWTSQEDRHLLLCRELSARGIQPVLIFSAPVREFEQKFRDAGALVFDVNYQKGALNFYRRLRQIFRDNNVMLAHVIFFDYFSPVTWIVRAAGVKPVIYEMQNSGIFRATSWKRILLRLRTRTMTAPMTRVIAISEFVKEQLVKAGVSKEKIIVRYLGIDTERFTPDASAKDEWISKFNLPPGQIIASTVSYLRPFKNPDILVKAFRELKTRNVPVRLFVAGGGEMLSDLKELSRKLDVEDYIHWLGNVSDPKSLLQASDMFLLASTGEAFGLVLAEAMACGVPIVGTRSGSLPEVVEEGKTGLLVPPRNFEELATAIQALSTDTTLRHKMAAQALERVKNHFTVQDAVLKTIDIYERLRIEESR